MNKKTKKQIQVLQQRLQKLSRQLSGARQQPDAGEIAGLEREIAETRAKLARLKEEE